MIRLAPPLALILLAAAGAEARAAEPADSPWHARPQVSVKPYDLKDEPVSAPAARPFGSHILAGRQVMANAVVGFGLFGLKADKAPLAPATARDLALPKPRKAAIGMSLRF